MRKIGASWWWVPRYWRLGIWDNPCYTSYNLGPLEVVVYKGR